MVRLIEANYPLMRSVNEKVFAKSKHNPVSGVFIFERARKMKRIIET